MTTDAQIIAEFEAIEAIQRKTLRGADYQHIKQTVARKLDVTPERVRDVMLARWTENMGAG